MAEPFSAEARAEHRRFPRMSIKLQVRYKRLKQGDISPAAGSMGEDVGAGGMAMRCSQELPAGQLLMLSIYLPPENLQTQAGGESVPEQACTPIAVLARVAWTSQKNSGEFLTGVQFLDLNRNHRKLLKAFLVNFHLDQPDSFLYQAE
jgi:c-di-GMP-binding flagellar brake protein YcgR